MEPILRLVQAGVAAGCTRLELHLGRRPRLVYHGGRFCLESPSRPRAGTAEAYLAEGLQGQTLTDGVVALAEPPDAALLLRRCQYLPIPVVGDLVLPRRGLSEPYLVDHHGDGCHILLPSSLTGPALVLWLEAGVLVGSEPLPGACPGARIIADVSARENLDTFRRTLNRLTADLLERPLDLPYHGHEPKDYLVATLLTTLSLAAVGSAMVPSLMPVLAMGALLLGPAAGLWASRHTRERLQAQTHARIRAVLTQPGRRALE